MCEDLSLVRMGGQYRVSGGGAKMAIEAETHITAVHRTPLRFPASGWCSTSASEWHSTV